jgi:hypothetical protein
MRFAPFASTLILAALAAVALVPERGVAQGQQLPTPPNGFRPPPPPPIKPYKPVAATPPVPYGDQSYQAFRKQLSAVAAHKDRAGLGKMVVAQGFFWMQDKDLADNSKSGIDNFAKAIGLDAKDGSGWDILTGFANDPTAGELPDHKGVICAPADPTVDPKQFEALGEATQTDPSEWGYPIRDGVELRSAAQPNAPLIEKLGLYLVRVLPDTAPPDNPNEPAFLHVAAPSGKIGFAAADAISPLGGDQICYTKDASAWKITGYFGGASQ